MVDTPQTRMADAEAFLVHVLQGGEPMSPGAILRMGRAERVSEFGLRAALLALQERGEIVEDPATREARWVEPPSPAPGEQPGPRVRHFAHRDGSKARIRAQPRAVADAAAAALVSAGFREVQPMRSRAEAVEAAARRLLAAVDEAAAASGADDVVRVGGANAAVAVAAGRMRRALELPRGEGR